MQCFSSPSTGCIKNNTCIFHTASSLDVENEQVWYQMMAVELSFDTSSASIMLCMFEQSLFELIK
jgi:hypothetical protein